MYTVGFFLLNLTYSSGFLLTFTCKVSLGKDYLTVGYLWLLKKVHSVHLECDRLQ